MTPTPTPEDDELGQILSKHLQDIRAGHDGKLRDGLLARERRLCLEAQLRILRKLFQGYKRPLKASNAEILLRTIEDKLARLDAELQKGDV